MGRPKKELATAVEPQQQLLLSAVDQTVLDDSNLESADEAAQPMGVMMQVFSRGLSSVSCKIEENYKYSDFSIELLVEMSDPDLLQTGYESRCLAITKCDVLVKIMFYSDVTIFFLITDY